MNGHRRLTVDFLELNAGGYNQSTDSTNTRADYRLDYVAPSTIGTAYNGSRLTLY